MLRVVYKGKKESDTNKCATQVIKPVQLPPTESSITPDNKAVSPTPQKIPNKPTIITWRYIFHKPEPDYPIGTIQVVSYKWKKLALPKRKDLHIPKKLCLWYNKLISRKYQIVCDKFNFIASTNTYHALHTDDVFVSSKVFQKAVEPDVIFIPIFTDKKLDIPTELPDMLKIELIDAYNKLYNILVS